MTNLNYFIKTLFTTNLFRMASEAYHTHQVNIASDPIFT